MPIFLSNSKIQIIFTDVPGVDEVINLTETSLGLNLNTIFKLTRTTTGQTQLPTYIPESYPNLERWVGFISANYKTSFVTDYGSLGFTLFSTNDTITTGTGTVTIFANFENAVFTVGSNTTTANITITNKTTSGGGTTPTSGGNIINLTWDGATDDNGISAYQLQWRTSTTSPWSSIISVNHDPAYGLNTATAGGGFYNHVATQLLDHFFRIRIVDSVGQYSGYKEIIAPVDSNVILISPINTTTGTLACSVHPLVPTDPIILVPSFTPNNNLPIPANVTVVKHTDNSVFNGSNQWWRILTSGVNYGCRIDTNGTILYSTICSSGGGEFKSEFISSPGQTSNSTNSSICTQSANQPIYYTGTLTANITIIYDTFDDNGVLSGPIPGGSKYYLITEGSSTYIVKISNLGMVLTIQNYTTVCTTTSTSTCCFVKGTKVSMFDNTNKNIEDVEVGDIVITYNEETKEQEPGEVTNIASPVKSNIVEYKLSNDTIIKSTTCHPYWAVNKGWSSFNPLLTKELYDFNVEQIEENDTLLTIDTKEVIVNKITELITKEVTTYNLEILGNHTYYANSILVHNKTAIPPPPQQYDEFGNQTSTWTDWYTLYGTTPTCYTP